MRRYCRWIQQPPADLPGWELAKRLHQRRQSLPIAAIAGAATDESLDAWTAAGVEEVLRKPIRRDELLAAFSRLRAR